MNRPDHLRMAVLSAMLALPATCGLAATPAPRATTARPQRAAPPDLEEEAQVLAAMAPKAGLRLGVGQLEIGGEQGGVPGFEPLP